MWPSRSHSQLPPLNDEWKKRLFTAAPLVMKASHIDQLEHIDCDKVAIRFHLHFTAEERHSENRIRVRPVWAWHTGSWVFYRRQDVFTAIAKEKSFPDASLFFQRWRFYPSASLYKAPCWQPHLISQCLVWFFSSPPRGSCLSKCRVWEPKICRTNSRDMSRDDGKSA